MQTNQVEAVLAATNDFAGATHLVDVPGMSSPKICNLLNALVARMDPGERYLEIGCWRGRTLLSAALNNMDRVCIGCDKFRLCGPPCSSAGDRSVPSACISTTARIPTARLGDRSRRA